MGHKSSGSLKHAGGKDCRSLKNKSVLTREARPETIQHRYHAALPLQQGQAEGPKTAAERRGQRSLLIRSATIGNRNQSCLSGVRGMSEEQVNLAAVVPLLMPSSLAKCGVGLLWGRRGQNGRSNKLEQEDDDAF